MATEKPIEVKLNAVNFLKNLPIKENIDVFSSRVATILDYSKIICLYGLGTTFTLPASLSKDGYITILAMDTQAGKRILTPAFSSVSLDVAGLVIPPSTSIYFEDNLIVSIECHYRIVDSKWSIKVNRISEYYNIMDYGSKGNGSNDSAILQSLIDRAPSGSTILLPKHHKLENIIVNKSMRFVAYDKKSRIDYAAEGASVFIMNGEDLENEFDGLNIKYTGGWSNTETVAITGLYDPNGYKRGSLTVRNCTCWDASHFCYPRFNSTMESFIVENNFVYYTHGRGSVGNASGTGAPGDYSHPCVGIMGAAKYTRIQNNYINCLYDTTFTNVDPDTPPELYTPADGGYKTAGYTFKTMIFLNNTVINHAIEAIIIENVPFGEASTIISGNITRGTPVKSDFFGATVQGIVALNAYHMIVNDNHCSDAFQGIALGYTVDTEANVVQCCNNMCFNVNAGLATTNVSSKSKISGNLVHTSSKYAKDLIKPTPGPHTVLFGIYGIAGTYSDNVVIMDDPLWTATLDVVSVVGYDITVTDATGVINGGLIISTQKGIYNYIPVQSVAGNVITIVPGWLSGVTHLGPGPMFYDAAGSPDHIIAAAIVCGGGGTMHCFNNTIRGGLRDFAIANDGVIHEMDTKCFDVDVIAPASLQFHRHGQNFINNYLEPIYKNRQRFHGADVPAVAGPGYAALNNGGVFVGPGGFALAINWTLGSSVVTNLAKDVYATPIFARADTENFFFIDYSKPFDLTFNISHGSVGSSGAPTNDSTVEILVGVPHNQVTVQNAGAGGFVSKGVGFRLIGITMYVVYHDGTTQQAHQIGTLTQGVIRHVRISSNGDGTITASVSGQGHQNFTGGPTGAGTNLFHSVLAQAWNKNVVDPYFGVYNIQGMEIGHR